MTGDDRARYRAVEEQVFAHHRAGRYVEGAELARAAVPGLAGWRADLAHAAACLLALAGRPAEALAELTAALDAGAWWDRRLLVADDDLAGLRTLDGFDRLVEVSHRRASAATGRPVPPVVRRPAGTPVGVLVALHGAGEEAADAARCWAAAVDAGWLLVAVTSTQRSTPTYRSWPDQRTGVRDIAAALDSVDVSGLPLVAAGFSAGGRQAVHWALTGPAVAFLVVGPALRPGQFGADVTGPAVRRGLTGRVLLGDADDEVRDDALTSVVELRAAGLDCALDRVPGLGHAFPTDFADRLPALLARYASRQADRRAG
ncbi:hypothetical protein [Micromonospora echinofusca]|uniref:Phospholipase n=1 Tax=Micromonospora echinofusca TaxID=47858 RepID=A0ABS3VZZ3_MICEH|nr:hypothetical protein [Micromonospora echinofusca]MBO4209928.1 phospholipase [Micromonospora echinofusca]